MRSGKIAASCVMPLWMRWMLVDSSGSMKPLASPSAMQFLFQNFLRRPVVKLRNLRLGQRLAIEIRQQRRRRLVIADEATAVHVAVADPMLQRNAPLPAGTARR